VKTEGGWWKRKWQGSREDV